MKKNSIKIKNLKKIYNNRAVVSDVSIDLKKGEVIGLLGPNGAGKTTCFYMIAGLINTDEGDIILDRSRINHLPMHMRAKRNRKREFAGLLRRGGRTWKRVTGLLRGEGIAGVSRGTGAADQARLPRARLRARARLRSIYIPTPH